MKKKKRKILNIRDLYEKPKSEKTIGKEVINSLHKKRWYKKRKWKIKERKMKRL